MWKKQQQKRGLGKGKIAIAIMGAVSSMAISYVAGDKQVGKKTTGKAMGFVKSLANRKTETNSNEE